MRCFHQAPGKKSSQRNLGRSALKQLPDDQAGCRRQQNPVTKVPVAIQQCGSPALPMIGSPSLVPGRSPLQLSTTGAEAIGGHSFAASARAAVPRPMAPLAGRTRPAPPWPRSLSGLLPGAPGRSRASAERIAGQAAGVPAPQASVLSGALPPQPAGAPGRTGARLPPMPRNSSRRRPRLPFRSAFSLPLSCPWLVTLEHFRFLLQIHPSRGCGQRESRAQIARIQARFLHPAEGTGPSVANPGIRLSASCALRAGHTVVSSG